MHQQRTSGETAQLSVAAVEPLSLAVSLSVGCSCSLRLLLSIAVRCFVPRTSPPRT